MKFELGRYLFNVICAYLIASVMTAVFLIAKNNEWGNPIALEILQLGFVAQALLWVPIMFILRWKAKRKSMRETTRILMIACLITSFIECGFFAIFLNY